MCMWLYVCICYFLTEHVYTLVCVQRLAWPVYHVMSMMGTFSFSGSHKWRSCGCALCVIVITLHSTFLKLSPLLYCRRRRQTAKPKRRLKDWRKRGQSEPGRRRRRDCKGRRQVCFAKATAGLILPSCAALRTDTYLYRYWAAIACREVYTGCTINFWIVKKHSEKLSRLSKIKTPFNRVYAVSRLDPFSEAAQSCLSG